MGRDFLRSGIASVRRSFSAHVPLYVCSAVSVGVVWTILGIYDIPPDFAAAWIFLAVFLCLVAAIAAGAIAKELVWLARQGFPPHPLSLLGRRLLGQLGAEDRVGNIFHACIALFPLLMAFVVFKNAIATIHPFDWDVTLSNFDKTIGFGHQPWRVLQPLLGYAPVTIFLSWAYYVWFLALFGSLAAEAFSSRCEALRMQFLLAIAFAFFIAGCLLAVLFSSAGPCYFAHLYPHADPYAAQMSYLRGLNGGFLPSVVVQDALWRSFSSGRLSEGISAMPSLHVTIAVLIALLVWRKGGVPAAALALFAFAIVLGSVHLAWHYASDSLAGVGLAGLFWYAAGAVVTRWNDFLAQHREPMSPSTQAAAMPHQ